MRNKLRTVLTGFSVAWGIFMLMILLGSGRGLENGVMSVMSGQTINVIRLYSWQTSIPYKGHPSGRNIEYNHSDTRFIGERFGQNARYISGGFDRSATASAGEFFVPIRLSGQQPSIARTVSQKLLAGRWPNEADVRERRKVATVEQNIADILYPGEKEPIGKHFVANGVDYTIIGIVEPRPWGNTFSAFVPLSTLEAVYAGSFRRYSYLQFLSEGLETKEQNEAFNEQLETSMKQKHQIAPDDPEGIYINNRYLQYTQQKGILGGLSIFIWLIGASTLLAGIVGVSNIMLVTVRERMQEIGIRKAIGATPRQILVMILAESLVITLFFGYLGLVAGMGVMEGVNAVLERMGSGGSGQMPEIFTDPTIDMGVALSATLVLVIAGLIAGFIPARRAVRMKTIDTLRQQK